MKHLKKIGKILNKIEQKQISAGNRSECFECLPDALPDTGFACAGSDICQVMPDGCHICV